MRPSLASLAVAAVLAVAAAGAAPAAAAEPYDSQLLALLVPPPDPAFTEITAADDPGRSGPLDATRLAELGVALSPDTAGELRGAAVRGWAGPAQRVIAVAYELTDAEAARATLAELPPIGEPFEVQGIPGAIGRATSDGVPTAFVGFVLGTRSFLVVVGGPDPGHALLQDTALLVVSEAATQLLPGAVADDRAGGRLDETPVAVEASDEAGEGWRVRVQDALEQRDVRLGLAVVAALGLLLLARRNRPAPPVVAPNPFQRNTTAWRHDTPWSSTPVLPGLTPPPAPGGHVAAPVADSFGVPDAPVAPAPAFPSPTVPAPGAVVGGETYSFPGADEWPEPTGP